MSEPTVRLIEDFSQSGVYQILNTVNGKRYVGSAVSFKERWKTHRTHLRQGKHHSILLQRAWNKYGEKSFAFAVIEYTSREDAVPTEQMYITSFRAADRRYGYNVSPTAGSCLGVKHSQDVRERRSVISKGMKRTEETKRLMSEVLKKRMSTPEARAKASANARKQFGTPEARKALSERQTGRKASSETCYKISAAKTGTKHTGETRRKMSVAHKQRFTEVEVRERMKSARQKRWDDPEQHKRQTDRLIRKYADPAERLRLSQQATLQWAEWRAKRLARQKQQQMLLFQ